MSSYLRIASSLVIAAALALARSASADQQVNIGFASPLTGPDAHYGKDNENWMRLAVQDLNQSGITVNGQKLKFALVSEDDQEDPRLATVVAQRIVDQKVTAIVGHFTSGTSIPPSPIYHDAGIPHFSVCVNSTFTHQGFGNVFRLSAIDSRIGPAMAEYAVKKLGAKTVALVDDRTAYAQGLADQFEAAAKKLGAAVVRREYTDVKSADLLPIATSLRKANPDVIFLGVADAQAASFARAYRQLGMKAKVLGGDMFQSTQFLKLAGAQGEGYMSGVAGVDISGNPKGEAAVKRYRTTYGTDPLSYGPAHYDAAMMVGEAIKRSQSTDPAKLIAALHGLEYPGLVTTYRFDDHGDLSNAPITIWEVKGGKWQTADVIR